ncbi:MAG: hypothetical protein LUQ37_07465 [Methanoregulaceae archaeon]|nr:hypothetical protein [Methanoregulaceae archaeon]
MSTLSTITPGVKALFDLFPDEFLEWLRSMGDRSNRDKFDIAEQTMVLIDAVKSGNFSHFPKYAKLYPGQLRPPVSIMDVYDFMSLATKGIASPRTIRYWSDVIRKHDLEDIRRYSDVLPFDHFAVASHADDPHEALELAAVQTDVNHGVPPTADWLAQNMNRTVAHPDLPEYLPDSLSPELHLEQLSRERPADPSQEEDQEPPLQVKLSRLYETLNEIRRISMRIADLFVRGFFKDIDRTQFQLDRIKAGLEEVANSEEDAHV